jgi:hypothetical protein
MTWAHIAREEAVTHMASKPRPAISRDRWHRYTYEGVTYPGWTSIGKIVDKSEPLMVWAAKRAVSGLLDQVDALPTLMEHNSRDALLKMFASRSAWDRDRAADKGTTIHDHADRIVQGLEPVDVRPEHERHVVALREWWEASGWTRRLSEAYVVNTTLGYGGTFDLLARDADGLTVLADFKTGETYPEHRLQLLAYGSAEFIAPQGSPVAYPMPRVDRYAVLLAHEDVVETVWVEMEDLDHEALRACLPLTTWKRRHEKQWRAA